MTDTTERMGSGARPEAAAGGLAARRQFAVAASFLLLALLFAIVYTQAPLFTSNQNQYFLHGLAEAGYGTLDGDWLANTLDPTPVFSALVALNYQVFNSSLAAYLWYALLMGVYLYSLVGIVSQVVDVHSSLARRLAFLALVLLLHSAALRFALARGLGDNWTFALEDGVADQRLLGLVFQPSSFGVFLLLSIYLFLRGRPYLAVLAAVLAATVHPTYLLSAAALTGAYMLAVLLGQAGGDEPATRFSRPAIRQALGIGLLALAAVAPILLYTYASFGGDTGQAAAEARALLVDYRIPHHARVDWWFDATAVLKVGIVAGALWRVRRTRLLPLLLAPAGLALGLTLLQVGLDNDTLALLFPWRLSTWLVPLSASLLAGFGLAWLFGRFPRLAAEPARLVVGASLLLMLALVFVGSVRLVLDFDRKAADPARPLYVYVAGARDPGEVYLTPIKLQDFRLEAGAPAYVDFKSIPYRATDVLEWRRRVEQAEAFYERRDCSLLDDFQVEGVSHVVLELAEFGAECPGLAVEYQDENFAVLRIAND